MKEKKKAGECCVHDRPIGECKECAKRAEECCVHDRPVGKCKECAEKVYISFRKTGTEDPWQLLRVAEPRYFRMTCSPDNIPDDSCAVDSESTPLYCEKLAEKGYETIVTHLDPETRGKYVVNELEIIANQAGFKPTSEEGGYTADLQPSRK